MTEGLTIFFSDWPSNQLTKTEALSGSQHVVLWLTRTSMSDIPSVPSLKNLVQSSLFGATAGGPSSSTAASQTSRGLNSSKTPNKTADPIQRNFSTKSFSTKLDHEEEPSASIRKCETVIAISGMSSTASYSKPSKSSAIKSPLSHVFKHLSGSKNSKSNPLAQEEATTQGQVEPSKAPPQPPPSESGRACESPFPVSAKYHELVKMIQIVS